MKKKNLTLEERIGILEGKVNFLLAVNGALIVAVFMDILARVR
jgi:hypothetical protein